MAFLSIIVPVYNADKYLRECIDSVRGQSYQDWELVLVDDGSTDKSAQICREYAESDSRIRFYQKDNSGQYDTRLMAIRNAKGEYCIGLDSDDYLDINYLKKISVALNDKQCDILSWRIHKVYGDKIIKYGEWLEKGAYQKEEFLCHIIWHTDHSMCNKAIRTILFDAVDYDSAPPNIHMNDDYMMLALAVCRASSFYVIDDLFYNYRQSYESISYVYNGRIVDDLFKVSSFVSLEYQANGIFTDAVKRAEYVALLRTAGSKIKGALKNHAISYDEYTLIRKSESYIKSSRYEKAQYYPLDIFAILKCMRFRMWWVLVLLYSLRGKKLDNSEKSTCDRKY